VIARVFWSSMAFITYVYAGYPAALVVLSRLRSRPPASAPITPPVTLLVAAYNEESVIAHKIENSLALDYPPDRLQILVATDGSDDRTAEIVAGYAARGVELSHDPRRRGKMAAINRAMPRVTGEIVVFSDANNSFSPETIREIVAPFADPEVGGAGGAKTILGGDGALGDSEGLYWRYESFIKRAESALGSCTGVVGELFAIRRDLVQSPPDSVINDDFFMAMQLIRAGHRVVYVPAARSSERVSPSADDEKARRARIVAGRYQTLGMLPWRSPLAVWQIVSHKLMRPLVPFAMIAALLAGVASVLVPARGGRGLWRLSPPYNVLLLAGQAVFYGLAWLGGRAEGSGRLARVAYLPTFLVNSNLAALTGFSRILTRGQTTLWQRAARREEADLNANGDAGSRHLTASDVVSAGE
jgi:poly-beta-1,6-N-acetyl-D-glucosamine synthase